MEGFFSLFFFFFLFSFLFFVSCSMGGRFVVVVVWVVGFVVKVGIVKVVCIY